MSITIIEARIARGYSGQDHRISGHEIDDCIGAEFRDWRSARRALNAAQQENAEKEVRGSPVWVRARVGKSPQDIIERLV